MLTKIHIGKIIKHRVKQNQLSVSDFADKINYTSRNAYKIFAKQSLDTSLLQKVGKVLEHNFFIYYLSEEDVSRLCATKTHDADLIDAVKDLKSTLLKLNHKESQRKH